LAQAELAVLIIKVLATREVTLSLVVLLLTAEVEEAATAQDRLAAQVVVVAMVLVALETLLAQVHRKEILAALARQVLVVTALVAVAERAV
jgi:hypothetical protein